jgi:hypothetical protein
MNPSLALPTTPWLVSSPSYYACFNCRALFAYPVDESPICGECEYDGFNAALLVQAMDAEMQTDDLPALATRSPSS